MYPTNLPQTAVAASERRSMYDLRVDLLVLLTTERRGPICGCIGTTTIGGVEVVTAEIQQNCVTTKIT